MMTLMPLTQQPLETSDFTLPQLIDRSNTRRSRGGKNKPTLGQIVFVMANRFLARISTSLASSRLQQIFETPRPFTSNKDDLKILERATISWLAFDGAARLPLYSFGDGPTILLVHGLSGSGSQLCSFVAPLTQAGFRVVICDLPAHGRADGKRISFPKIASAIELIAAHIGPVAGIIAHSNGAATTALALSRDLETQALVFISPPEDLKGYLYRLSKMIGFNKKVTQHAEKILAQNYGLPFDAVRGSNLVKNFTQPLLVFHDMNDKMVSFGESEKITQNWQGSHLVKTKGLGHNRILKDPDVISTAVNFISHHHSKI